MNKLLPIFLAIPGFIFLIIMYQRNMDRITPEEREKGDRVWTKANKRGAWVQIPFWLIIAFAGIWGNLIIEYYPIGVPLVCGTLLIFIGLESVKQQKVLLKAGLPAAYVQNKFYLKVLFLSLIGLIGLSVVID